MKNFPWRSCTPTRAGMSSTWVSPLSSLFVKVCTVSPLHLPFRKVIEMDACAKCNCSTSILWMQRAQVQWSNFGLAGSQSRFCCARRKNSGPLGVWPGAPTDWWFGWSSSSITSSSSEDSTDSILTSITIPLWFHLSAHFLLSPLASPLLVGPQAGQLWS